jgi:hypothetical protein
MKWIRHFFAEMAACAVLAGCGGGGGDGVASAAGVPGAASASGIQGDQGVQGIDNASGLAKTSDSEDAGFDVILLAGQSNMVGWNHDRDPVLDAPDPRIFQLGLVGTHKNQVIAASDPLEHPDGNRGVGPAMQFAKAYLNSLPAGRRVLLVPSAFGGTGFSANHWNPGNDLFEQAVARANVAMAKSPNNRFAGILWHQGESDVSAWGAAPDTYKAALDKAIYTFRARISGAASAPMVLGKFTDGWGSSNAQSPRAAKAAIMAAIDDTPNRVPFTAVAQSAGLAYVPNDVIHFSAAGEREQGLRYFAQLPNAQAHALAAFTLPVAPGALAASSGASWIKLSWTAPAVSGANKINGYRVAYRLAGGTAWTERHVDGGDTSAFLLGLTPGANYAVRVAAVGQAGLGAAAQLDAVATRALGAIVVPPAPFEYTFENGSLANTGSLGTPMNGTAAGTGVVFVTDAARGKVMNLPQGGWANVPRAINGTAYTKSVWVKFTTYGGYQNLVSSDNPGRSAAGVHALWMPANQPVSSGGHGGAYDMVRDPTGLPLLNTWYHFAAAYDGAASGGTLRLFRNGVKVAEKTGVPPLGDQAPLFKIGAFNSGTTLSNGFLDNVRVYDVALSDDAISDTYAKEVAP